jgi:hypothetical protein
MKMIVKELSGKSTGVLLMPSARCSYGLDGAVCAPPGFWPLTGPKLDLLSLLQ